MQLKLPVVNGAKVAKVGSMKLLMRSSQGSCMGSERLTSEKGILHSQYNQQQIDKSSLLKVAGRDCQQHVSKGGIVNTASVTGTMRSLLGSTCRLSPLDHCTYSRATELLNSLIHGMMDSRLRPDVYVYLCRLHTYITVPVLPLQQVKLACQLQFNLVRIQMPRALASNIMIV